MTEWILAFDAGCGKCNEVIDGITDIAGERLTVAGLGEDRIRALRHQALGDHAPFAPTLLAVDTDRVRAWAGPRMSVRLSLLLGPRRSLAVARALNRMDVIVHGDRRRFLKAAPGVALGVFLFSGGAAAPAMAAPGRRSTWAEAKEWVAQLDRLPRGYDEIVAQPLVRRRALFAALPQQAKQDLWVEHLDRFRRARAELSAEQSAVLSEAATLVPAMIGAPVTSDVSAKAEHLKRKAIAALGADTAYAALAVLGPAEPTPATNSEAGVAQRSCGMCSTVDDWCDGDLHCENISCEPTDFGCGTFWQYPCDGDACLRYGE